MKMKSIVVLILLAVGVAFAQEKEKEKVDNLLMSEVTASNLKPWVESAKFVGTIDKDGDLICETPDYKFVIEVDSKRKLIKFASYWKKPDTLDIQTMKNKANEFNESKILVSVYVDSEGDSVVQYYMVYNAGVKRVNFLETLDWFVRLDKAWSKEVYAED